MEQRAAYPNCFWKGAAPSTCFGVGKGGEGGEGKFHADDDDGDVDCLNGAAPAHLTPVPKVFPEMASLRPPGGGIYCEDESCVTYQESGSGLIDKFSRSPKSRPSG